MKIFRSKRPELSRGHWREKVSDLFGQTAHFSPVGSGRKKFPKKRTTSPVSVKWVLNEEISKSFVQNRRSPPVGTEGKMIRASSKRLPRLQRIEKEEIFKIFRSKPVKPSSG